MGYKLGQRKTIDGKLYSFHSMAFSKKSLEAKKNYAKSKGYSVRSIDEDKGWSFWTRKNK